MTHISPKPPTKREPVLTPTGRMVLSMIPTAFFSYWGLNIVLRQTSDWLKTGVWIPWSLHQGLEDIGFNATTDMIGLNKIVDTLPMSGCLFAVALACFYVGLTWANNR